MDELKLINKKLDDLEQSIKWLKTNVSYISYMSIIITGTLFFPGFFGFIALIYKRLIS